MSHIFTRKISLQYIIGCLSLFVIANIFTVTSAIAQPAELENTDQAYTEIISSLKTLDPGIVQYFPRWTVCEPNLMIQLRQVFNVLGRRVDGNTIRVTAAPRANSDAETYDILLIEMGENAKLMASDIESYVPAGLRNRLADTARRYCYQEIPVATPPTSNETQAIISYLEPTNVQHSFSISAFEQSMKIGQSGFWLRSILGTDQVGYHFWSAGEAKVVLQRPLYQNTGEDELLRRAIPYLINAHLGGAYRITGGLEGGLLSFLPNRKLNGSPGGKMVAGLDFHMPFAPEAGLSTHLELPFQRLEGVLGIDATTYAIFGTGDRNLTVNNTLGNQYNDNSIVGTAYLLRSTGQVTAFYNWWLNRAVNPENFFRFDLGMNYTEVREAAVLAREEFIRELSATGVDGLETFKPREFGDWVYAKVEYRNQAAYPFGASLQYSNQILLGRVYVPLFGSWLYLEGKYSTPLRPVRPYEIRNFFMISPILRLNI